MSSGTQTTFNNNKLMWNKSNGRAPPVLVVALAVAAAATTAVAQMRCPTPLTEFDIVLLLAVIIVLWRKQFLANGFPATEGNIINGYRKIH